MSAHTYHAHRQLPESLPSPVHSSVIAAALGMRARKFSFVDDDGEAELLAPVEVEEAAAAAAAAAVAPAEPSPSSRVQQQQQPNGTFIDGAVILFTAIGSFPALSLPWAVSTMTMGPGVAAVVLCGVATAGYSCWLVSYLVGHRPAPPSAKKKKEEEAEEEGAAADDADEGICGIKEEEGSSEAAAAAAAAARAAADKDGGNGKSKDSSSSLSDFRHARYHDMVAAILGHRTASLFVTPIQVVVCFGICVAAMLIGGTSLKALSKLLRPQSPSSSPSSSSSSSPLTLSQWIAVFAAFQTSSAFVPSLASSVAVAVGGSVAFLLYWGLATAYSAVAGVRLQQQQQPLPADFYSLAGATPAERAFAALSGLGVALFAWSNAFAPEVQSTLREPHGRTMRQSTALAFGLLSACYAVIGGLGYWAFGKGSDVVVLLNMEPVSRGGVGTEGAFQAPPAALAVAWVSVVVNLYALFAVYAFPVYECLDAFVARRVADGTRRRRSRRSTTGEAAAAAARESEGGGKNNGVAPPPRPPSPPPPPAAAAPSLVTAVAARAAGRILFCGCCALIAAALPFFGDIAAVLGVLSLALDFILPCVMFHRVKGGRLGRLAVSGLVATSGFYVLLGGAVLVAALRSLFINAHTYKLFADM